MNEIRGLLHMMQEAPPCANMSNTFTCEALYVNFLTAPGPSDNYNVDQSRGPSLVNHISNISQSSIIIIANMGVATQNAKENF